MTNQQIQPPRREALALRAALYGRASSDPKKRGRSIKDQFAVGELECLDHGWTIIDRYEDRDRSASRRARKVREDWERLIADVEAGKIDVIVFAERSRASRDMEVSMKLRSLCEQTGVQLFYDGRLYDMRKSNDRKEFTRDAVASEEEAETTIERAERTARLNALRGAPHGKIPVGFIRKYDEDDGHLLGQFPHPTLAPFILDLFQRADRRESFQSLENRLAEHVPAACRAGVRYLLTNRAYIGQRGHKGKYVKATWDGFVPEDLFWRVQTIVSDPARRTQRETRAKYRLSGIGRCAHCVEAKERRCDIIRRPPRPAEKVKPRYACRKGHASIGVDMLDAFVEENLLAWMGTPAFAAAFAPAAREDGERDRLTGLLVALRSQLADAQALAGALDENNMPRLSIASLAGVEGGLLPQIARAERSLQQLLQVGDPLLDQLLAAPAEEREQVWAALPLTAVRHVIRRCVNVTLHRASGRGVRTLQVGRVTLIFAGQPGFVSAAASRQSWAAEEGLPRSSAARGVDGHPAE